MGLSIEIKNVTFTKKIRLLVPVSENLIGYWIFNDSLDDGIKNKVSGVSGTLVGAPTVSAGKINADKANGFITDITISGEKTFITIAKSSANAVLLGSTNYDNTSSIYDGLMVYQQKATVQMDSNIRLQKPAVIDISKIHFMAASMGVSGVGLFVSNAVGGLEELTSPAWGLTDNNPLRIGGWGVDSKTLVGSTEVYAALVYNKKLSTAEVQSVFDYFKAKLNFIAID
ncbi:TPA: hypothetical protein PRO12_003026 [Acinetobacter baumannii]|nr:hypothetical protein [Acinetobacter baumannii]